MALEILDKSQLIVEDYTTYKVMAIEPMGITEQGVKTMRAVAGVALSQFDIERGMDGTSDIYYAGTGTRVEGFVRGETVYEKDVSPIIVLPVITHTFGKPFYSFRIAASERRAKKAVSRRLS